MRWDIVTINFAAGTISEGGIASARANDNSKITLTGSGTFELKPGNPHVTGGGTWVTFTPRGVETARGAYWVTDVVRFEAAPGTLPGLRDLIGDRNEASAGLAVLTIQFSDDSYGTLVVSCHLTNTPDSVFEGITVSKGFVDYWNREAPPDDPPGDANRTLFHITP